jgi:hypothetical protein
VANYFEKDKRGNAANRAITTIDSSNNIVFDENGTTIALLGVHDLIVVRTQDCPFGLSPARIGTDQRFNRQTPAGTAMTERVCYPKQVEGSRGFV